MKWQDRRRSSHIEDRRGAGGGGGFRPTGGGPRLRIPSGRRTAGGAGGLGLIIVVVVVALALGVDPMQLLSGGGSSGVPTSTQSSGRSASGPGDDEMSQFVAVVLAETEDLWTEVFTQNGLTYTYPDVVLYTNQTQAGCGLADAGTGPFYCPADQKVYIDLSFYQELRDRFGAPGDFAQAYVLAHEIGHHVQQLTGILPEFNQKRQSMSQTAANAYSVRIELQADCYAGIWANYAGQEDLLEDGDIEEALNAATRIGDDRLQTESQGYAVPRTFTHGTSEQRKHWFATGYESGDVGACDTINASSV